MLTCLAPRKGLAVILSDATVPGEGEHKLIEHIRNSRGQKDYDPNCSHCICGQDADLMMLGLALHEMHVTILREEVFTGRKNSRQAKIFQVCVCDVATISRASTGT